MSDPETPQARFAGFVPPKENWSKLPHDLIDQLPAFKTLGELKVVLYILRHTWGFEGTERRRISLDEFQHGRRKKDGSRIDAGVGMSKPNIVKGLKLAEQHGFITVTRDDTDKGRKSRVYELRMNDSEDPGIESKPLGKTGIEMKPQSDRNETPEVLNQTVDHRKKPMKDTSETLPDATAPDAPVPPKAKRKSKPKHIPRGELDKRDLLYEAVEQHIFGVNGMDSDPYLWTQPVGGITKWLRGEIHNYNKQPLLANPTVEVTPEMITDFVRRYRAKYSVSIPTGVDKFINHWVTLMPHTRGENGSSASSAYRPMMPAEIKIS